VVASQPEGARTVTTSLSHDRRTPPGLDLAQTIRTRLQRPASPLPRADLALFKMAAGIVLVGLAAFAVAVLANQQDATPEASQQPARIGDVALMVPQNLTGVEADDTSRLVGMVRLRLDWPSLGPAQGQSRSRLLVTLSPPDKVNEPATQLAVYARFLTPTVWSNPGGLVVRGFRKGSPYEGDEFYVSVPDGRGFAARCPLDSAATAALDELCRVTFRHRGIDVNIRFPRAIIADWELMLGGVRRTIDGMMR
jgi:hypothetical protein